MAVSSLVEMFGIGKRFGPIQVLDGIDFELAPGEVHILAGENGAGKSTLIKILAGIHRDFEGRVIFGGQEVKLSSPLHANQIGVAVIHQELSLIPTMNVADNLFLGRPLHRMGVVQERSQHQLARKWLTRLGLNLDTRKRVGEFSIAQQQLIEIAKAISLDANIIVMDEPTSALNTQEVGKLFEIIEDLKRQNCGIVYISHKMDEIQQVADRITVLRDGKLVGTAPAKDLPTEKMVQWMVGRETNLADSNSLSERACDRSNENEELSPNAFGIKKFSVFPNGMKRPAKAKDVTLSVGKGEVVGMGGLEGAGISELFYGIFGAYGNRTSGSLLLDEESIKVKSPRQAIKHGIALLTNDRKSTGLVLSQSIVANITLASLKQHSRLGWLSPASEFETASKVGSSLQLIAPVMKNDVSTLSGGNQQKVAIAKWLETQPRLLLLDEPTRGIDIGAKQEIYRLIDSWKSQGISILLRTTEMPELLLLSDRIYVMHRGDVTAEYDRASATPEKILQAAMGNPGEES